MSHTTTMNHLTRDDLYSLEQYATRRKAFRAQVLEHKKLRTLHLGPHMTLIFEDRLTVQYQIQEMLRIERVFEAEGIEDELAAYNPLIPDGHNLKATCLMEYAEREHRARELARLRGIEHRIYVEVAGHGRSLAIADEDLDRSDEHKTSAVHFLRFEFNAAQIEAIRSGAALTLGVDDERYGHALRITAASAAALAKDFG